MPTSPFADTMDSTNTYREERLLVEIEHTKEEVAALLAEKTKALSKRFGREKVSRI